ncbi:5-oxoprolinase subunit B family protein [Alteromonas sp. A079]|uniref:5-oxoprolinase subunit B family protein n=1 Tax=Alteromonas sp. A079 TaxID=3410268 RepID=UPI003BA1ABC4
MQPFGNVKQIVPAGIDGLLFYFNGPSLDAANAQCLQFCDTLASANLTWIREVVPAYDSVLVVFDAINVDSHYVYGALSSLATVTKSSFEGHSHTLPVWYGANDANDLSLVATQTGLSETDVITLHTSVEYCVYAVGFAPGFGYMGSIPEALSCPRLATPRKRVPEGAVAIADRQTAVYPSVSPGGWHLLGLCPLRLTRGHDALLKTGDKVIFKSISEKEFIALNEY